MLMPSVQQRPPLSTGAGVALLGHIDAAVKQSPEYPAPAQLVPAPKDRVPPWSAA